MNNTLFETQKLLIKKIIQNEYFDEKLFEDYFELKNSKKQLKQKSKEEYIKDSTKLQKQFLQKYLFLLSNEDQTNLQQIYKEKKLEKVQVKHQIIEPLRLITVTEQKIIEERRKLVESVFEVVDGKVSKSILYIILRKYKWDGNKFLEDYLHGEFQEIKTKTGIELSPTKEKKEIQAMECQICLDVFEYFEIVDLKCHRACKFCFLQYISKKVEVLDEDTKCFGYKCNYLIQEKEVKEYCSDEIFQKFVKKCQISFTPYLKYCTNSNCSKVFGIDPKGNVRCMSCSTYHCYTCNQPGHFPMSCEQNLQLQNLMKEGIVENETILLTKQCPACFRSIEKNGGCNHMVCKCKFEFCWICLDKWYFSHICKKEAQITQIILKEIKYEGKYKDYLKIFADLDFIYRSEILNSEITDQDKFNLKELVEILKPLIAYIKIFNINPIVELRCDSTLEYITKKDINYIFLPKLTESLYNCIQSYEFTDFNALTESLKDFFGFILEDFIPSELLKIYKIWKEDMNFQTEKAKKQLKKLSQRITKDKIKEMFEKAKEKMVISPKQTKQNSTFEEYKNLFGSDPFMFETLQKQMIEDLEVINELKKSEEDLK